MADPASPAPFAIKVPLAITAKLNPADVEVAEDVMMCTGITDGVQLFRYCLRAAQRELRGSGKSTSRGRVINPG